MSKPIRTSKVGIFYRESNSQSGKTTKTYYYKFKNKRGKTIEKKVGTNINGFNVGMAVEARTKAIQLDTLGSESKYVASSSDISITLDYVAEIHFDIKAKKNSNNIKDKQRYNNHIGFIEKYHQEFIQATKEAIDRTSHNSAKSMLNKKLLLLESRDKTSLLGSCLIEDIGSTHIDKLMNQCDDRGLGAKSKDTILASLSAIFETAINKGIVGSNPIRKWRKDDDNINPKSMIDNESERYLTEDEKQVLYKAIENETEAVRLFVHIALKTGARANSICNIKKKDIVGNMIRLSDEKRKKVADRIYKIPLSKSLREVLQPRLDVIKPNDFIIDSDYENINRATRRIFAKLFNRDLNFQDDRKLWVSNHTLRHTFASLLAIKKTPIFTIMKLMHHADIKMTIRYAKLNEEENGSEYMEMIS